MLAYHGQTPRFHESDFRMRSQDGVGDDWPISYSDLEPYYTRVEYELGSRGPGGAESNPFEPPRSKPFPTPAHELSCASRLMQRGAQKLGLHWVQIPLAIPTVPWGGRPSCARAGVCGYGCRIKAKSSMDVTYVPKAEATGHVEIRPECLAREIVVGQDGRARSVIYFDGVGEEHEICGRAVVVAGNAIETPRLLLEHLEAISQWPCEFKRIGRQVSDGTPVESSRGAIRGPLDPWMGPPGGGLMQDFYETNKRNGFVRGWQVMPNQDWSWPQAFGLHLPAGERPIRPGSNSWWHTVLIIHVVNSWRTSGTYVTLNPGDQRPSGNAGAPYRE